MADQLETGLSEKHIPLEERPAGKMIQKAEDYFRVLVTNPIWNELDFHDPQMRLDSIGSGFYYNDWTEEQVREGLLEVYEAAARLVVDHTYECVETLPGYDGESEVDKAILRFKKKTAGESIEDDLDPKIVISLCETIMEQIAQLPKQAAL